MYLSADDSEHCIKGVPWIHYSDIFSRYRHGIMLQIPAIAWAAWQNALVTTMWRWQVVYTVQLVADTVQLVVYTVQLVAYTVQLVVYTV